jgi:hypothetical protein
MAFMYFVNEFNVKQFVLACDDASLPPAALDKSPETRRCRQA